MDVILSPGEVAMLEYLFTHSGGSGERISLDPRPITRALRISSTQFATDAASLAAHGFAGVRDYRADTRDVPSLKCSAIWVTRKGEDYLKGLRRKLAAVPAAGVEAHS